MAGVTAATCATCSERESLLLREESTRKAAKEANLPQDICVDLAQEALLTQRRRIQHQESCRLCLIASTGFFPALIRTDRRAAREMGK